MMTNMRKFRNPQREISLFIDVQFTPNPRKTCLAPRSRNAGAP